MKRTLLVCALGVAGSVLALATSCKQGEGERCQVDDDCSGTLECNKAKNTCQSKAGGDLDASVIDLSLDAPPDAAVDMMPDI